MSSNDGRPGLISDGWSVVYESARRKDGSLFFPERLNDSFLDRVRKTMGSYIYANQYQNEVIPEDEQKFMPDWLQYYESVPRHVVHFAMVDPAISQSKKSDYTACVVVAVDESATWYVRYAKRAKLTPTQQLALLFKLPTVFPNLMAIGVEKVAYQAALIMFAAELMRGGQPVIPLKEVTRGPTDHKNTRILGLVPRFEWQRVKLAQGLHDLENELIMFPRASHDDLSDALASIADFAYAPGKEQPSNEAPAPNSPEYESWYIRNLIARRLDES